ncbi:MAG: penicillin-binding protein 2, partial [Chloroflexi bacterium]|nr:penicillin-binding protein 2 [Chloroflexota bacterium]
MSENIKTRFLIICVICSVVAGITGIQMIRIQNSEAAQRLLSASETYQGVNRIIYPDRGNIYDSKGRLLAGNETSYEIGLDLNSVTNSESVASIAASVLGLDYAQVLGYAKMKPGNGNPYYVVLDDFVSKDKIAELETIKADYNSRVAKGNQILPSINGLVWTAHSQRSYPEGTLASNILGFYSYLDRTGGTGYYGLEAAYDSQLSGRPQQIYITYDPQRLTTVDEVPPGASLVLTLDREIQAMTEKTLDEAIQWSGAESGTILVYNPEDGGVIAMATAPRLDPNKYWEYSQLFPDPMPFNSAISQTYEPGSVFKVITMAAALDSGLVDPDTRFQDTGSFNIGGTTVYNWNMGAWGDVDMTECLQYSLNVCMTWLATEMGPDIFYTYFKNFGLDRKTGIDLGGENHWPLKLPGDNLWYEVDLATNSFGQGISLTP